MWVLSSFKHEECCSCLPIMTLLTQDLLLGCILAPEVSELLLRDLHLLGHIEADGFGILKPMVLA